MRRSRDGHRRQRKKKWTRAGGEGGEGRTKASKENAKEILLEGRGGKSRPASILLLARDRGRGLRGLLLCGEGCSLLLAPGLADVVIAHHGHAVVENLEETCTREGAEEELKKIMSPVGSSSGVLAEVAEGSRGGSLRGGN